MYILHDADGKIVSMKNGTPFTYSTSELATLGKRLIEGERKGALTVVKAA